MLSTSARTPLAHANENTRRLNARLSTAGPAAATADPSHVSKTPVVSITGKKSRRALGDISNRKTAINNPPATTTGFGAADNKFIIAEISKEHPPAATKAVSFAIARDGGSKVETKEARVVAPKTPHMSKLPARGLVDRRSHLLQPRGEVAVTFDDEEVELPAGRLWVDQPWLDDEDASVELSLEGVETAREEWLEASEKRHKMRLEATKQQDERGLRALEEEMAEFLSMGTSLMMKGVRNNVSRKHFANSRSSCR